MTRKAGSISGTTALIADGRWMATAVSIVAVATMGLLIIGPTAAHAADAHRACAVVLGLDPSQAPYHECIAKVERHVRVAEPPAPTVTTRTNEQQAALACADGGLEPGSLAAARCIADLNQSLSNEGQIYR